MQIETRVYKIGAEKFKSFNEVPQKLKLDECINNIVTKEGYISCEITKKKIPADGGNYLATLFEIDIRGNTFKGEKETSIFVKVLDSDCGEALEFMPISAVYKIELFVYKELTRIFEELQDDANVPINERYNTVKCYEESYERAIIMENVTRKGFQIASHRMDIVSLNVAEECVKQLAKLHGLSFVLERKRPEYFANKIRPLKNPNQFGESWQKFVDKFGKISLECLDDNIKRKIEKKIPSVLGKMEKYFTDENGCCLCHGDYRTNNIMIKETNGKVNVIPVDYQLIWFGCPALDFIYFIYMGTDRQFRNKHINDLKNLYYKAFEDFLEYFDMSAESIYPRKIFEHSYSEKLDFGLTISLIVGPLLFVSENNDIPDVINSKETISDMDFKIDDKFKERLQGVVEEFIDFGYF